jgi:hypothetical protein
MKKIILLFSIMLSGCSQFADKAVTIKNTVELEVLEVGLRDGEEAAIVRYDNELQSIKMSDVEKGEYITVNVLSNHTLEVVK